MIYAVMNNKGGQAKTTTVENLIAHYRANNETPVGIDLDTQGDLTIAWDIAPKRGLMVGDLMLGRTTFPEVLAAYSFDENLNDTGVLIIPTDGTLENERLHLMHEAPNHDLLDYAIQDYNDNPMFIDCPPAADILGVNALVAATPTGGLLIPVIAEKKCVTRTKILMREYQELCDRLDLEPNYAGIIITMFQAQTKMHQTWLREIQKLDIPILGIIPKCSAQTQDGELYAAYRKPSHKLLNRSHGIEYTLCPGYQDTIGNHHPCNFVMEPDGNPTCPSPTCQPSKETE